jgi:hypothetical protein
MVDWIIVRMKYAPQIAMTKTPISSGVGSSVGSNAKINPAATGSQSATMTNFDPANQAMSLCSGCSGRSRSRVMWPSRMRHSQKGAPKTTFMLRTSVQTM